MLIKYNAVICSALPYNYTSQLKYYEIANSVALSVSQTKKGTISQFQPIRHWDSFEGRNNKLPPKEENALCKNID